ncbi:MAG: hypothetical protein OXC62_12010, partial [Aestuariivita sp.]|nr:hypothetical protein [Aestuariivita sp.]
MRPQNIHLPSRHDNSRIEQPDEKNDTEGWKGECEHGVGVRDHLKGVTLTQVSSRSLIRHEHHP